LGFLENIKPELDRPFTREPFDQSLPEELAKEVIRLIHGAFANLLPKHQNIIEHYTDSRDDPRHSSKVLGKPTIEPACWPAICPKFTSVRTCLKEGKTRSAMEDMSYELVLVNGCS